MALPVYGNYAEAEVWPGDSIGIPKPSGLVSGQGVVVFISKENSEEIEPPPGFVELGSGVFTSNIDDAEDPPPRPLGLHAFVKRATSSDVTNFSTPWAFSWDTAIYGRGVAVRISGVAPAGSFVDVWDAEHNSTEDDATPAVAVTTTGANRLLVWCGANYWGGNWTPPSGFTERWDSNATLSVATMAKVSAGASGNVIGECSSAMYSCGFLVAVSDVEIGGGEDPDPVTNAGLLPILMI